MHTSTDLVNSQSANIRMPISGLLRPDRALPFLLFTGCSHRCINGSCRQAKEYANSICPKTPEIEEKFAELPAEEDELDDKIAEAEARLDGITLNNPGVMREFKERQKKINDLRKRLDDTTTWLQAQQAVMLRIRVRPC